jgi:hypothetical protein
MSSQQANTSNNEEGFSPLTLKQQLDSTIARLEAVEDRVTAAELDIRNINSYSMRKNLLFNGVVTKEDLSAPRFDLRRFMIKFMNDELFGRNRLTDLDLNDVHATQAEKGDYRQVFVEFRLHDDALDTYDHAKNCADINQKRKDAANAFKQRTGRFQRPVFVSISWQMENVARKMQAYLYELKNRMKECKPNLNAQAINVTAGNKKDKNPKICFAGKSYTVFDLPVELQMLMVAPWSREYQRPKGVFRPTPQQKNAIDELFLTNDLGGLLLAGKPNGPAPAGGVGRGKRSLESPPTVEKKKDTKNRRLSLNSSYQER